MVCVAGAHFVYGIFRCQKTSTNDVVYQGQVYLNKVLLGQYTSTDGRFTGYTEYAKEFAEGLNKSPRKEKYEKIVLEDCRTSMKLTDVLPNTGEFGDHTSIYHIITEI